MINQPGDAAELLPLTEPVFQVLLALADEDRHGYGIMREVADRTEGRVQLGPGTLYGAIKRLRDQGLVEESPPAAVAESDERRRYYHLTPFGWEVARLEAARLQRLLETAHRMRLLPSRGTW